jgi:hypothetical protein
MVHQNTGHNIAQTRTYTRKVADAENRVLAPEAKAKLIAKDMDVSKLTKKEICSLLVTLYAATEKLEKKKKD